MKLSENQLLRTFKDLFLRPNQVYKNTSDYSRPWSFALAIAGPLLFVDHFLRGQVQQQGDDRSYELISDRLASYYQASDAFNETFEIELMAIAIAVPMIFCSFVLFKKARTEPKAYFAMLVYTMGVLFFLLLAPEIIYDMFEFDLDTLTIFDVFAFGYLAYANVSFFGNKVLTYVKIPLLFILLEVTAPLVQDFLDNLYVVIFQRELISKSDMEFTPIENEIRIGDGRMYFTSPTAINDSTSYVANFRDDSRFIDLISNDGLTTIASFREGYWPGSPQVNGDSIILYGVVGGGIDEYPKTLQRFVTYKQQETHDTVTVGLSRFFGVSAIGDGRQAAFGRDSSGHPAAIIVDRDLNVIDTVRLDTGFENLTFTHFRRISDSTFFSSMIKWEDRLITNYKVVFLNRSGSVLKSIDLFQRKDLHAISGIGLIEFSDSGLVFIPHQTPGSEGDELWISLIDLSSQTLVWQKEVEIVNDQLTLAGVKWFNGKLFFAGKSNQILHGSLFGGARQFNFIGSIDEQGEPSDIVYFGSSPYTRDIFGLYTMSNELFAVGNAFPSTVVPIADYYIRDFAESLFSPYAFRIKVLDSLDRRRD